MRRFPLCICTIEYMQLYEILINVKSLLIRNGSEQFKRFVETPQPLSFKVYIFNITNPDEVQQGAIPTVSEIGPYVYRQYRRKIIKEFSKDNTTVTYVQQQFYIFDKVASLPYSETDNVTVVNMHMNAFLQAFESEAKDTFQIFFMKINKTLERTPGVRLIKRVVQGFRGKRKTLLHSPKDPALAILMRHINANIKDIFNNPKSMFLTTSVNEYLFEGVKFCINPTGLARAICNQIKEYGSKTIRTMEDGSLSFSYFHHKNQTEKALIEVNTGIENIENIMKIKKWNAKSYLNTWLNVVSNETMKPSICNMINGTDASLFAPFHKKGDSMYIFSSDICRSVQLFYEQNVMYSGIPGFRYSIGANFVNDIGPEYSNECFCIDKLPNLFKRSNGCLYSGALDLTHCMNAPVILTLPHMLGAANEYNTMVHGLKPNMKKHKTFVDVEINTGIPLRGGKRIQFNMFLKPIKRIKLTENLRISLVPSIWIEEGIALSPQMVRTLKSKLINTLDILNTIYLTILVSGVGLTIMSSFLYCTCGNKIIIKTDHFPKVVDAPTDLNNVKTKKKHPK
ncbi:sensory neuron membrane protein 2 [Condylostylus longicornis]|uniref:sensory neuron membrane protein 2 n=1 Tax=Condylostylus longicornis TaxID=2530218 RepID=UPI00244E256E|nr:sensory neuron membrane protein 2 [Condylostylus longicornis]